KKVDREAAKEAIVAERRRMYGAGGAPRAGTPSAGAEAASAGGGIPGPAHTTSQDVFVAVRHYLEKNPEVPPKIGTVFQIKLSDPESLWTLDFKNGQGAVIEGAGTTPDVTLEVSDADWVQIAEGKQDPQKLFFGGKLKIGGNMMAATKLEFLKKVD